MKHRNQKVCIYTLRRLNNKNRKKYISVANNLSKCKKRYNLHRVWKQTFDLVQILVHIVNLLHEKSKV